MLVLSRKTNESLFISDNIEIVVLEIRRGVVRMGINAPRQVSVVRSELRDAKLSADPSAVHPDPVGVTSEPTQIPLTDGASDRLLHSFGERRRSW